MLGISTWLCTIMKMCQMTMRLLILMIRCHENNAGEEQTNSSNNPTPRNSGGINNELSTEVNHSSGKVPVANEYRNVVNPCVVPVTENIMVNEFPRVDTRSPTIPAGESMPTVRHILRFGHSKSIDGVISCPLHKKFFDSKLDENENVEYY